MKGLYLIILGAGLISLLAGTVVGSGFLSATSSEMPVADTANWVSPAVTIADQVAESDVIVRAQVIHVNQARKLRQVGPRYTFSGKVDDNGVNIMPFTDSEMMVLEVYMGSAEQRITVMQTGGSLPEADGDPAMHLVTWNDPLFVAKSEYILFLKDISGDPVHGRGRRIYRTVNPAGRYEIRGTMVSSIAEFPAAYTPPRTLDDLVRQIKQAVSRR